MPLVTSQEVRAVVDTVPDTLDLDNFIETASLIVTEQLTDPSLSANRKKLIELYLAAHFTAISLERGGLVKDKTGDGEAEYSDVYEGGFAMTRFGQSAMQLDTTGVLKEIDEAAKTGVARFTVV